jgi:hypothetical protein
MMDGGDLYEGVTILVLQNRLHLLVVLQSLHIVAGSHKNCSSVILC